MSDKNNKNQEEEILEDVDLVQDNNQEEVLEEDQEVEQAEPISELDTLKMQVDEYKIGWQRANADYQNLLKQTQEKRSELVRMSEWQIISEFLPVYSYFKKAMDSKVNVEKVEDLDDLKKQVTNWETGVGYILKQFISVLEQHGITEIKTVGEQFDIEKHEALKEEPSEEPEGKILKEVDPGYELNGKVILPAKVITSTGNLGNLET